MESSAVHFNQLIDCFHQLFQHLLNLLNQGGVSGKTVNKPDRQTVNKPDNKTVNNQSDRLLKEQQARLFYKTNQTDRLLIIGKLDH